MNCHSWIYGTEEGEMNDGTQRGIWWTVALCHAHFAWLKRKSVPNMRKSESHLYLVLYRLYRGLQSFALHLNVFLRKCGWPPSFDHGKFPADMCGHLETGENLKTFGVLFLRQCQWPFKHSKYLSHMLQYEYFWFVRMNWHSYIPGVCKLRPAPAFLPALRASMRDLCLLYLLKKSLQVGRLTGRKLWDIRFNEAGV